MIDCEFESGRKASLRHVTIGAIAVNDRNQVLLVKRDPSIWNGNKYAIPGGFLGRDEDAKQATIRELKEETGYDGEIAFLFRINDNPRRPKEDRQNVDLLYIAKVVSGEPKLNEEVAEIKWFAEEDLPSDEEFAFDHRDSVIKYFQYLKQPRQLPIIG